MEKIYYVTEEETLSAQEIVLAASIQGCSHISIDFYHRKAPMVERICLSVGIIPILEYDVEVPEPCYE